MATFPAGLQFTFELYQEEKQQTGRCLDPILPPCFAGTSTGTRLRLKCFWCARGVLKSKNRDVGVSHIWFTYTGYGHFASYSRDYTTCLHLLTWLTNIRIVSVSSLNFSNYVLPAWMILTKSGLREAPPTRKPSTSGFCANSCALAAVTDPKHQHCKSTTSSWHINIPP